MKLLRVILSYIILAAFAAVILPKEFIHQLCSHDESEHRCDLYLDGPAIDHQHLHCKLIELTAPPVVFWEDEISFKEKNYSGEIIFSLPHFTVNGFLFSVNLRGPPALFFC